MIAPRNGVHVVAETDHYQLLDLDNEDSRLGVFGNSNWCQNNQCIKQIGGSAGMVKGWHEITMLVCSMKIIQKSLSGSYRR